MPSFLCYVGAETGTHGSALFGTFVFSCLVVVVLVLVVALLEHLETIGWVLDMTLRIQCGGDGPGSGWLGLHGNPPTIELAVPDLRPVPLPGRRITARPAPLQDTGY